MKTGRSGAPGLIPAAARDVVAFAINQGALPGVSHLTVALSLTGDGAVGAAAPLPKTNRPGEDEPRRADEFLNQTCDRDP